VDCLQIFVSDAAIKYEVQPTEGMKDIAVALVSRVNANRTEIPQQCSAKILKFQAEVLIDSISLKCSIRTDAELHVLLHEN
jgi:hypothetical protein